MAQDRDVRTTHPILRRGKRSTVHNLRPKKLEEFGGDASDRNLCRLASVGQVDVLETMRGDVRKDTVLPPPCVERLDAGDRRRRAGRRRDESNQRGGIGGLERPEHDCVHDREDRCIGADAERQREDGDGGETWVPAEASKGIRTVLPEFAHVTSPFLPESRPAVRSAKNTRVLTLEPDRGRLQY